MFEAKNHRMCASCLLISIHAESSKLLYEITDLAPLYTTSHLGPRHHGLLEQFEMQNVNTLRNQLS